MTPPTPAMPWHERASVAKACPDLAPSILGMLIVEAENAGEPEYAAEFQAALDGEWSDLEWLFNRDALAERFHPDDMRPSFGLHHPDSPSFGGSRL